MLTIICGDALEKLRELPSESVQCCVTSPPYWGLRDYGIEGQLGLEKTPEEYVAKLVEIFREVRRVLRKDATLWLNLGDSYCASQKGNLNGQDKSGLTSTKTQEHAPAGIDKSKIGLKQKDLVGIPWMVAFALRADGWYLRSDIIWAKPNPMPESVTDRPTKSHEYLFLFAKSQRYFYDAEAIKERGVIPEGTLAAKGSEERFNTDGVNSRPPEYKLYDGARNKRSVWTVATAPYPEAHFATYPPDLIKPCILAGTSSKGCCSKCGAPWQRLIESPKIPDEMRNRGDETKMVFHSRQLGGGGVIQQWRNENPSQTVGWQPICKCNAAVEPCTVIDPFAGSGTTGMVALELGRKSILIELNEKYIELMKRRCYVTPGLALA